MGITDLFLRYKKEVETSEDQKDEQLKTHYYEGDFDRIFQSVEQIIRQDADCRITTLSKESGEIGAELTQPFPCYMTATVISEEPSVTAVDFSFACEKQPLTGSYPKLKKRVVSFYERVDDQYNSLGINEIHQ
jgi:hypothetical protein